MQIAQVLAGYSLGEADLLRRAMGKKIRKEMQAQRTPLHLRRGRTWRRARAGRCDFRIAGTLRRLRLQQEPRRGLRAGRLSDGLSQGELPGRVPRGLDDARHGQHRQAVGIQAEAERLGITVEPPSVNRSASTFEVADGKIVYALAALKGVGAPGGRGDRRGARRAAVHGPCRFRPSHQSARRQQARAGKHGRCRRLRCDRARSRARLCRCRRDARGRAAQLTKPPSVGQNELFGGAARARRLSIPADHPWLPAERLQREFDAVGFFLTGHPLDDYAPLLKGLRVQSWAEFSKAVKAGATRRTRRRDGRFAHRTAHQDRQQDGNYSACPIRPASTRRSCSPKGCRSTATLLEPGNAVLLFVIGGGAGRRRPRPHPDGRAARKGRREGPEGTAGLSARCRAAGSGQQAARSDACPIVRHRPKARPTARSTSC